MASGIVIGLDIGRYSVKAAWVRMRANKPSVLRTEMLRLPLDDTNLDGVIGPWLAKLGIGRTPCVIGLQGQRCVFQPFALLKDDPRTDKQIAAMEVRKFMELSSEAMNYDFTPFTVDNKDRRLMLSLARVQSINEILQMVMRMGVNVIDIVPAPVAVYNIMETLLPTHRKPFMFVNVGFSGTDIAVGVSNGLIFVRSFPCGGQMFTDALAKNSGHTFSQAEHIKLTRGSLQQNSETAKVFSGAADIWLADVRSCLSVYSNVYPAEKMDPQRLVMVGGGAELPGFAEYAAKALGRSVENLRAMPGRKNAEKSATFAVPVGLAVTVLTGPAPVKVSFLPSRMRDDLVFRSQKPYWIAAGITAILALAVLIFSGFRALRRLKARVDQERAYYKTLESLDKQIVKVKKDIEELKNRDEPLKELLDAGPKMRRVIDNIADTLATNDWVAMVCDIDSYYMPPLESTRSVQLNLRTHRRPESVSRAPPLRNHNFYKIIIEGYTQAANYSSVKDFIMRLKQAPFVADADLLWDDAKVDRTMFRNLPVPSNQHHFVISLDLDMKNHANQP